MKIMNFSPASVHGSLTLLAFDPFALPFEAFPLAERVFGAGVLAFGTSEVARWCERSFRLAEACFVVFRL